VDAAAAGLAAAWLDSRLTPAQVEAREAAVLAAVACAEDAARLRALAWAFAALRAALFTLGRDGSITAATETALQQVAAVGWPRATRLAEVAWAWARFFDRDSHPQALALLLAQQQSVAADPAYETEVPALERAWLVAALSTLHCVQGEHDQALAYGLRAEALANAADDDMLRAAFAQVLAFVYLSVGDVEGASAIVALGLAAKKRCGIQGIGLPSNVVLTCVLAQRFDDAAQFLIDWPELTQPAAYAALPSLQALVARVRLSQGDLAAAANLPQPGWAPGDREAHATAANRLWLTADVLVGLGRPAQARQQLLDGLAAFEAAGVTLLPMNATQVHRALADACEAVGDLPAAMAALRQSQLHCFTWVGQSMRSRLQALHFAGPADASQALQRRQGRRLKMVQGALAAAYEETQVLQTTLDDQHRLLAKLTHEVRNPLQGMVWMTSMLMMSNLDDRQREYLHLADSSARMALSLCNDVLDLAKMDAGEFQLRVEPVALAALVADCAKVFEAPARAKGLALQWQCDPALPPRVLADPLRLQQVLMNLLSNATKFTRAGRIDVDVRWLAAGGAAGAAGAGAGPTVRLAVADTGDGVPEDLMPRLFQEFAQAESASGPLQGGSGLGLALCRQFVRLMGGEIGVDNRPGRGCTFWCLLPLQAA
jgi:signal transduction histidine kinase